MNWKDTITHHLNANMLGIKEIINLARNRTKRGMEWNIIWIRRKKSVEACLTRCINRCTCAGSAVSQCDPKNNRWWASDPGIRPVICNHTLTVSYVQSKEKNAMRNASLAARRGSCTAEFPPTLNMRDTSEPTVTIQWWAGLLRQSWGGLNGLQWEAVGWVSLRLWSFSPGKVVKPGCLLWSNPAPLQPYWCTPVILDFLGINLLD